MYLKLTTVKLLGNTVLEAIQNSHLIAVLDLNMIREKVYIKKLLSIMKYTFR